jgi:hypothetical protein
MSRANPVIPLRLRQPAIAVLLGLLVGSSVAVIQPATASAVSLSDSLDDTPRRIVSYCIESTPNDVTDTQARVLLDRAIAHWELTGGLDGNPAVNLSHDNPCDYSGSDATDVRIQVTTSLGAIARADDERIRFDDGIPFWDGLGTRQSSEYAYEGILAHEMGHTMGAGHTGQGDWTFDGGGLPTMAQCGTPLQTAWLDTLQQDDYGVAVNIGTHATGKTPFWNSNPGFERELKHWARSTSAITASSTYKETGTYGVRIPAANGYLYITSVYDPYHPDAPSQYLLTNMTDEPTHHVRTDYRHSTSATGGGVILQYEWWYLQYNAISPACKAEQTPTSTTSSGTTTLLTCGDRGTSWSFCDGSVDIDNSSTNDATVFRARLKSSSTSHLYLDRAGAYGGTSW